MGEGAHLYMALSGCVHHCIKSACSPSVWASSGSVQVQNWRSQDTWQSGTISTHSHCSTSQSCRTSMYEYIQDSYSHKFDVQCRVMNSHVSATHTGHSSTHTDVGMLGLTTWPRGWTCPILGTQWSGWVPPDPPHRDSSRGGQMARCRAQEQRLMLQYTTAVSCFASYADKICLLTCISQKVGNSNLNVRSIKVKCGCTSWACEWSNSCIKIRAPPHTHTHLIHSYKRGGSLREECSQYLSLLPFHSHVFHQPYPPQQSVTISLHHLHHTQLLQCIPIAGLTITAIHRTMWQSLIFLHLKGPYKDFNSIGSLYENLQIRSWKNALCQSYLGPIQKVCMNMHSQRGLQSMH